MDNYIFENILKLETPVGYFYVTDGTDRIPFSVKKNLFDVPYEIYDDDNRNVIGTISTETNYALVINTIRLKKQHKYFLGFSNGTFSFGGSDEHTESIVATIGRWSLAIGSYNPNDQEEMEQSIIYSKNRYSGIISPPEYDESKFVQYTVSPATEFNNGFEFKLLDYTNPIIVFYVAWIEHDKYNKDTYESALDFWVT